MCCIAWELKLNEKSSTHRWERLSNYGQSNLNKTGIRWELLLHCFKHVNNEFTHWNTKITNYFLHSVLFSYFFLILHKAADRCSWTLRGIKHLNLFFLKNLFDFCRNKFWILLVSGHSLLATQKLLKKLFKKLWKNIWLSKFLIISN